MALVSTRSDWTASNARSADSCQSTGVFEKEFFAKIKNNYEAARRVVEEEKRAAEEKKRQEEKLAAEDASFKGNGKIRAEFKGVPIGASKSLLLSKLPEFSCENDGTCHLNFLSKRSELCEITACSDCPPVFLFGSTCVKSYFIVLQNDKVANVQMVFNNKNYYQTLFALEEKYGQPNSKKSVTKQNMLGGSRQSDTTTWLVGDSAITIEEYHDSLETSRVEITANWYDGGDLMKKKREDAKRDAQNL